MFRWLLTTGLLLLSASSVFADVTITVGSGTTQTCLGRMYSDILQPGGWGALGDTTAPTRFVQSDMGTLGLTLFFEARPADNSNYDSGQVMQGVGFTAINRTSTTGFLPRGYTSFKAITKNMSSVWVSKTDGSGDLQSAQKAALPTVLNEAPTSQDCNGFIWALQLGESISVEPGGGNDPGHFVSPLSVQNPAQGSLWFNSTGKSPNSKAYFIVSLLAPRYPSGSYHWYFYGQNGVTHGTYWY